MTDRGVVTPRRVAFAFEGLGLLLGGVALVEVVVHASQPGAPSLPFVGGLVTSLPFVLLLAGSGRWLAGRGVSADRYPRIAKWALGGFGFFVAFFGLVALAMLAGWDRVGTIRWAAAVGAGGGLLVGVFEARAIEQATARERATVRAEEAERRRELLAYLNALLRHEVLNATNVVEGYAALLEDPDADPETGPTTREYAGIIRRQAGGLEEVTTDVRLLLDAAEGTSALEPIALRPLLRTELDHLDDRHERVETELEAPDDVYVRADGLIRRLFANLLDNAVEHNDGAVPRVRVAVEAGDDAVTVRIEDDGPGIPVDEREELFEYTPGSGATDHGLGLAIVDALADRYGGEVELSESRPGRTVFGVVLPRVEPDARHARRPPDEEPPEPFLELDQR